MRVFDRRDWLSLTTTCLHQSICINFWDYVNSKRLWEYIFIVRHY